MQFKEEHKHMQCPAAIWYALGFNPVDSLFFLVGAKLFKMAEFPLQWIIPFFFQHSWYDIIFTDSESTNFINVNDYIVQQS